MTVMMQQLKRTMVQVGELLIEATLYRRTITTTK
jgi:hypothetical protein